MGVDMRADEGGNGKGRSRYGNRWLIDSLRPPRCLAAVSREELIRSVDGRVQMMPSVTTETRGGDERSVYFVTYVRPH